MEAIKDLKELTEKAKKIPPITVRRAQRLVESWCTSRALDEVPIMNKLLFLIVEVAEAVQELKHSDEANMGKVETELADVFIYLLDICNRLNVNLEASFRYKMHILQSRGKKHRHSKLAFEG